MIPILSFFAIAVGEFSRASLENAGWVILIFSIPMTLMQPIRIEAPPRNPFLEALLQRELGIGSLLAGLLVARGITDLASADKFLNPKMDDLGDPKKLPDYRIAVDEILGARERGDLIFIHGDYDVDGVTSASMFARFLKGIGANVHVHVPHRMKEGYGVHSDTVKVAAEMGAKLFLTCDCGVSAHEQVDAAKELGMRVVVTDHHTVGDTLPAAQAVVNPHRKDSEYPFAELCGAGVVFRLCEGINSELGNSVAGFQRAFLDLVVLGTVADVMPLVGENRILVRNGLPRVMESKKKGIQALLRVSQLTNKGALSAGHVGFQLGPRLNAAGRIEDAATALQLLLTTDDAEANQLAEQVDAINQERRATEAQAVLEAIEMVEQKPLDQQFAIVVGSANWHAGVVGLVASKLREKFNRPAYVMNYNLETGVAKGSARSIPHLHLYESIKALGDLVSGGGHRMAAGFSAKLEDVERVKVAFNDYAVSVLTSDDLIPVVEAEIEPTVDELTFKSFIELEKLEPYGQANPTPTLCVRDVQIFRPKSIKNGFRYDVCPKGGRAFEAVEHNRPDLPDWFKEGVTVDATFNPEINRYDGERPTWKIRHFEPKSGEQ